MKLKITVHGVAYEVEVEVLDAGEGFPNGAPSLPRMKRGPELPIGGAALPSGGLGGAPAPAPAPAPASNGGPSSAVTSPVAGTVVELKVKVGDEVDENEPVVIIEAMKMNTTITAPAKGKVKAIPVAAGDAVREGQTLVEFS